HGGLLLLCLELLLRWSCGFLLRSSSCRFDRGAHDHLPARSARNGTADQEQVALGIDTHDRQVFDRAAPHAHVPGHALAGEHAARRLTLTDGAGDTVRYRGAVRSVTAREIVALHDAGESLTDGRPRDVDDLTFLEQVDLD